MEKNLNSNRSAKGAYDWKLVQRALKKGDQKAYAELMGRYTPSEEFTCLPAGLSLCVRHV